MTAIKTLKELYLTNNRVKYPSMPEYARVIPKYTDRTANGLTKCILIIYASTDARLKDKQHGQAN
jgi:hypothetical protein